MRLMGRIISPHWKVLWLMACISMMVMACGRISRQHQATSQSSTAMISYPSVDPHLLLEKKLFPPDYRYYLFPHEQGAKHLVAMFTPSNQEIAHAQLSPPECSITFIPEIRILHKNIHSSAAILVDKVLADKPTSTMFIEILIHHLIDYSPWQDLYQQGKCLDLTLSSIDYPHKGDRSLMHLITQLEPGIIEKFPVKNLILSQLTTGNTSKILMRRGDVKIYAKLGFATDIKGYSLIFEETSDRDPIDDTHFRAFFQHAIAHVYTRVV